MDNFLGEIQLFGFDFAPRGYQFCNGQTLAISQFSALFALLGTTYGGNGQTTFQLPNLQGRVPIHQGNAPFGTYVMGETAGAIATPILLTNLPSHSHTIPALAVNNGAPTTATPSSSTVLAMGPSTGSGPNASTLPIYTTTAPNATLGGTGNTGLIGNNVPISIQNPFLVINYCIAMVGLFPSRN
jgi:microcystin-dependent protein